MGRRKKIPGHVLTLIFEMMNKYCRKYSFGYVSQEDVSQEIYLICSDIYSKYDKSRGPLRNFMEKSLRNRLRNFKRDWYFRPTPPCITNQCHKFNPDLSISDLKCRFGCKKYIKHQDVIRRKMNIMNNIPFNDENIELEFYVIENDVLKKENNNRFMELDTAILNILPENLHTAYKRLKDGLCVKPRDLNKIKLFVGCVLAEEKHGKRRIQAE